MLDGVIKLKKYYEEENSKSILKRHNVFPFKPYVTTLFLENDDYVCLCFHEDVEHENIISLEVGLDSLINNIVKLDIECICLIENKKTANLSIVRPRFSTIGVFACVHKGALHVSWNYDEFLSLFSLDNVDPSFIQHLVKGAPSLSTSTPLPPVIGLIGGFLYEIDNEQIKKRPLPAYVLGTELEPIPHSQVGDTLCEGIVEILNQYSKFDIISEFSGGKDSSLLTLLAGKNSIISLSYGVTQIGLILPQ